MRSFAAGRQPLPLGEAPPSGRVPEFAPERGER